MFISNKTKQQLSKSFGVNTATFAVIDIGSSSIRMDIGQLDKSNHIEVFERFDKTVLLGRDVFTKGLISKKTMQQAVLILREYAKALELYKIDRITAVATSAIREADNSDIFVDKALMATGLDVNVINTCEQSRLTALAVEECLSENNLRTKEPSLIAEVGGGSTILVITKNKNVIVSQTLRLGSIRLSENFDDGEALLQAQELIDTHIKNFVDSVKPVVELSKVQNFIIIGSDARFVAAIAGKANSGDCCYSMTKRKFNSISEKLSHYPPAELVGNYDITYSTAQTLNPSLLIYRSIADVVASKKINILPVSMRDGLILETIQKIAGISSIIGHSETINSAIAIANKYRVYDENIECIDRFCEQLFHILRPLHKLEQKYCIILRVAAILHRVGTFISSSAYHKHTYYIMRNSDIFGLDSVDNSIAALVARYHRKSTPKNTHREYLSLDKRERVVVNKMAAILRFAIGLSSHNIDTSDICFELVESELKLSHDADYKTGTTHLLAGSESMLEDVFCISVTEAGQ